MASSQKNSGKKSSDKADGAKPEKAEDTQKPAATSRSQRRTDRDPMRIDFEAPDVPASTKAHLQAQDLSQKGGTRTEEDLLGTMDVPADAYYGIHTLRAVENFQISRTTMNQVPAFIRGIIQVKKAAALTNRRLHTLPPRKAEAIIWACDQILDEGRCMDQFPIDVFQGGAGTSFNMNANEVIANLALEYVGEDKGTYSVINPNDDVNMSQSTNDAYPTAFRLGVYAEMSALVDALEDLQIAFRDKGNEFSDILKMGRTQLQDAVPMTLGDEFLAFAYNLAEEQSVLQAAMQRLLEVNLGATAIGTGLNTPAGYRHQAVASLSEVTGLEVKSAMDLIEATSDTGAYVLAHSAVKRAATKLGKICNDLRLLSSGPKTGLHEINVPARQAGSSIMPGKVNPVIPEVVNQVVFKVFGNDLTVGMAAEAGQLQLNVMEPVIGEALFQSLRIMRNAAITLREKCVVGITANPSVCQHYVDHSVGIVTYLTPFIGHHNGDLVANEAISSGKSIRELVLEKDLMDKDTLDRVLSKENLMHPEFRGRIYVDDNDG